ncbi:MAG TPA: hypothetical protein VJQ56_03800 [Blastocatellia bacterium]|nr:hypothetical protein [Blastocatellia bacterium]
MRGVVSSVAEKNARVMRALSLFPVDVINLGQYDLAHAQKFLSREGYDERVARLPMIKNLISANGVFGPGVAPPAPFVIKEVRGPRIKGGTGSLKVGFLGLSEPRHVVGGKDATVRDMFETARALVPELRKKCDLLVLLSHADYEPAARLASENPEADVVIAGNTGMAYNPKLIGKTLVVSTEPANAQQGDLRVYIDRAGKLSFKFRSTDLDIGAPVNTEADEFVQGASDDKLKQP